MCGLLYCNVVQSVDSSKTFLSQQSIWLSATEGYAGKVPKANDPWQQIRLWLAFKVMHAKGSAANPLCTLGIW